MIDRLQVRRLTPDAQLPRRAHEDDAGLDLFAAAGLTLAPGERAAVPTGVAIAVPAGWAGLVVPRSGLARTYGLTVANAPGLIDPGYRGELMVLLVNLGPGAVDIASGDRIAQLVLVPAPAVAVEEVAELPSTSGRQEGGFGSTGR